MMNHMPAARRFAAGDGPAAAAIIRGLPDYFTDDVPAKVERDAASHQAWVLTDSGPTAIARELVVTLDTIKKHVGHVLGKLGAANRTEAVARARELNLIP